MALLNNDILFLVTDFSNTSGLRDLCLVSRALYGHAVRRLYNSVRITRPSALYTFLESVERHPWLAESVKSFSDVVEVRVGTRATFLWSISRSLLALPNLESISLFVAGIYDTDIEPMRAIYSAVASRARLRNLRLRAINMDVLPELRNLENISHFDVSFSHNVPIVVTLAWLFKMAQCTQSLAVDGVLLERGLQSFDSSSPPVFAQVRRLSANSQSVHGISPTSRLISAFPSLQSLSLGARITKDIRQLPACLDVLLPCLRHLELKTWNYGLLSAQHPISSLRLSVARGDLILSPEVYLGLVSSPNVRALEIDWGSSASFIVAASALAAFPGLTFLDVTVRTYNTRDINSWLRDRTRLPQATPPNLAALTIRWMSATAIAQTFESNDLAALSSVSPALKLLRIAKRIERGDCAFQAWKISSVPREIDWEDACEIASEHLFAAGASRTPWDDLTAV